MIEFVFWLAVFGTAFLLIRVLVDFTVFGGELRAALDRDPAAKHPFKVMFLYPGFRALKLYRTAHALYRLKVPFLPDMLSQWTRRATGIEIHPAAQIGKGFFIDHGMGVVIGETTIIGDQVTLYQGVTLGGNGKECGKRHPTLGNRVVVGAGAKILGNITIGDNVYVGANAVVVRSVPANCTVVGVPGRIANREGHKMSALQLDHTNLPDPITKALQKLQDEIETVERELHERRGRGQTDDASGAHDPSHS